MAGAPKNWQTLPDCGGCVVYAVSHEDQQVVPDELDGLDHATVVYAVP